MRLPILNDLELGDALAEIRTRARVEYRVLYVARPMAGQPHDDVATDLNRAAVDGWRLAGTLTNDGGRTTGLVLEREV